MGIFESERLDDRKKGKEIIEKLKKSNNSCCVTSLRFSTKCFVIMPICALGPPKAVHAYLNTASKNGKCLLKCIIVCLKIFNFNRIIVLFVELVYHILQNVV